jgi:hypothetical protein
MTYQIQLRRGTAAQWVDVDPVLAPGEPGVEVDANPPRIKIGNGFDTWSELSYVGGSGGGVGSGGYVHDQSSAAAVWTIDHLLNTFPNLVVILTGQTAPVITDVEYTSANQVVLSFPSPETGTVYLS